MKQTLARSKAAKQRPVGIKTTIMELLHALADLTQDDRMVLAAFKTIFASHNVRLAHTLAPVRLVESAAPRRNNGVRNAVNGNALLR
jgi:hypothetical protein